MTDAVLRSPLHDRHVALGAKFAGFAGWDMPLEYAGGGVIKEHTAVRERVGIFDVSHLGKITVEGPGQPRTSTPASPTTLVVLALVRRSTRWRWMTPPAVWSTT